MLTRSVTRLAAVAAIAVAAAVLVPPTPTTAHADTAQSASAFAPVAPCRLVDTRTGAGRVAAAGTLTVPVAGRCGVPASGVTAVAVSVTAVAPAAAGFVTAWSGAGVVPGTSTLNYQAGVTRANGAVVPVAADGSIAVWTFAAAHLVVDVTGWWGPVTGPVAAGRFRPVPPIRLADTRAGGGGPVAAGGSLTVAVPAVAVAAVAVNVTVTSPAAAGFASAGADSGSAPTTSTVNYQVGQTVASSTIIPVAADGTITVWTSAAAHLIVDLTGTITAATAWPATDGLLTPLPAPIRLIDTRTIGAVDPARTVTLAVPAGASAVAGNITIVNPGTSTYLTVWPATVGGTHDTSAVNSAGVTAANMLLVGTAVGQSTVGLTVRASAPGAHMIVDVTATFTGADGAPYPVWDFRAEPSGAAAWTAAPRTGTDCERYVLTVLDRFYPQLRPYVTWLEVREVDVIEDASATMATPSYSAQTVLETGPAVNHWVLTIRQSRCDAGYSRREYVIVHELAHMLDFLAGELAGDSYDSQSATAPHLAGAPTPAEWFADCAAVVLGAQGSPHYTACRDAGWQADTRSILAVDPTVTWRCAPVAVPEVGGRPVAWCIPSWRTPWATTQADGSYTRL